MFIDAHLVEAYLATSCFQRRSSWSSKNRLGFLSWILKIRPRLIVKWVQNFVSTWSRNRRDSADIWSAASFLYIYIFCRVRESYIVWWWAPSYKTFSWFQACEVKLVQLTDRIILCFWMIRCIKMRASWKNVFFLPFSRDFFCGLQNYFYEK